jgi:hypothetical protein
MTELMKRCTRCKQDKPATADYFQRAEDKYDGLRSSCKACRSKDTAKYQRTPQGRALKKASRDRELAKVRTYPKLLAVVNALISGRDESAKRLAKAAYAAALKEGIA